MNQIWRIIAESVIGSTHIRKNLPNQDNGGTLLSKKGYPHICVVSDGHGSKDYFRSDRGSAFAIQVAIRVILQFFNQEPTLTRSNITEMICKEIVKEWRESILLDIQKFPYDLRECAIIEEGRNKIKYNIPVDPDYEKIRPYGSTLLIAIITEEQTILFQLGDGDIVVQSPAGTFYRPISEDEQKLGNETYSLCMHESWRDFKINRLDFIPDFLMLSTDGYLNSFLNEEGFFIAVRDFYSYLNKADNFDAGVQLIKSNIHQWLTTTSQKGSGDDITLIIIAHDQKNSTNSMKTSIPDSISLLNQISSEPLSYQFLQTQSDIHPHISHIKKKQNEKSEQIPKSIKTDNNIKPQSLTGLRGKKPKSNRALNKHIVLLGFFFVILITMGILFILSDFQRIHSSPINRGISSDGMNNTLFLNQDKSDNISSKNIEGAKIYQNSANQLLKWKGRNIYSNTIKILANPAISENFTSSNNIYRK